MLVASPPAIAQAESIRDGVLDLRDHDWEAAPLVPLAGEWQFFWQDLAIDSISTPATPSHITVPSSWTADAADRSEHGFATYRLTLLLNPTAYPQLALKVNEFMTAFELEVNGVVLGGGGRVGTMPEASVAAFHPQLFPLPTGASELVVLIRGSNFDHRHGGLLQPPILGTQAVLAQSQHTRSIIGGILIGLLLMNTAYQWMRYVHRRQERTFLLHGLWTLSAGVHFMFLHERWVYQLVGDGYWGWTYKLELVTLTVTLLLGSLFLRAFFGASRLKWLYVFTTVIFIGQSTFLLVSPVWLAAQVDLLIPVEAVVFLGVWCTILVDALLRKLEGAVPMVIAAVGMVLAFVADQFLFGVHVGSLLPVHYLFSGYIFTFSWVLSRRSADAEQRLVQLGSDLEQSNQALALHNQNLELQVAERTAELVSVQQMAHDLEMEQVRRDIETLSATNQMKAQLTRNLIHALQGLLDAGGDYSASLRSLIGGLHSQAATEERLEVLQEDLEIVNAEFYRRLQTKCPMLSKTEREICAYMKLNLSGKDIALLRKTSINTINVARHRIRKKLGLEREEELESFVQQV